MKWELGGKNRWMARIQRSALALAILALPVVAHAQNQNNPDQPLPQGADPEPIQELEPLEGEAAEGTDPGAEPTADPNARATGANRIGVRGAPLGPGISLSDDGRARLHLALDTAVGFDINPYSIPLSRMLSDFSGDAVLRLRPRMEMDYPGSLIAFDVAAFADYGINPGLINPGIGGWLEGRRGGTINLANFRTGMNAGLEINRGGMFSFAVRDTFSFQNQPGYINNGAIFTSVQNNLQAGVGFTPGGGTLKFRLTGNFGVKKFFDWIKPIQAISDSGLFGAGSSIRIDLLDQMNFGVNGRVDWRFLPKTGLFAQAGTGIHFYPLVDSSRVDTPTPFSFPTKISGGVMGQFTSKLSGLAQVGYSNPFTFYLNEAATNRLVAQVPIDSLTFIGLTTQLELRWKPLASTVLAGGLLRRVEPTPLYEHITNNRIYFNFSQWLGENFVFRALAGYSVLLFGRDLTGINGGVDNGYIAAISQGSRVDGHLDVTLDASYFIFDWMSVGVSNDLDWRLTNTTIELTGSEDLNLSFVRNQTLLLLSFHY